MKKAIVLWITVIMLVAVFFRFYDLKNIPPGLWADEAMNGTNALEAIETGRFKVFYPENFGREGLFINIQAGFVKVFGTEPWVLRLPSAILGLLTVLGLYLMARELFGERIALFSAFFLATSFWHIMFSRIGFRAIMAPFFLVWAFYFLFKGMSDTNTTNSHANAAKFFALAGFTFGLGFHTYIAYRIAPLIAFYPLWKFYQNLRRQPPPLSPPPYEGGGAGEEVSSLSRQREPVCAPCLIALFVFMSFIAALPLLWYYFQNPEDFFGRTAAISIFDSTDPLAQFSENFVKTLGMFNLIGDFNWRHNLAGAPQLWWPVGLLFLLGLWLSTVETAKNPKHEARNSSFAYKFVLLWFAVMILPVALSNESLPHALRSIVLVPPAMIFAALGLESVINRVKKWLEENKNKYSESGSQVNRIENELAVLLTVFFIATATHAYNTYFNRWATNFNVHQAFQTNLTEKARWLKTQQQDIPKYVVTNVVEYADFSGTPMSFQPIIFIAGTKNTAYLGSSEFDKIACHEQCIIVPIESRPTIYQTLKQKIPGLRLDASPGFIVLKK